MELGGFFLEDGGEGCDAETTLTEAGLEAAAVAVALSAPAAHAASEGDVEAIRTRHAHSLIKEKG